MGLKADSLDKIVGTYFAAVTAEPFTWRGTDYPRLPLKFGPSMLRGFTCPAGCGGCCFKFTLDYLPQDAHPYALNPRLVDFKGKKVMVCTDTQEDNDGARCRNLRPDDGRCSVHGRQPFTCDFELLRVSKFADHYRIAERLFGRGWSYPRTDGGKGALCTITDPTPETAADVRRRLARLRDWCNHFGLKHRVGDLLDYCDAYADDPTRAPMVTLK